MGRYEKHENGWRWKGIRKKEREKLSHIKIKIKREPSKRKRINETDTRKVDAGEQKYEIKEDKEIKKGRQNKEKDEIKTDTHRQDKN